MGGGGSALGNAEAGALFLHIRPLYPLSGIEGFATSIMHLTRGSEPPVTHQAERCTSDGTVAADIFRHGPAC